MFKYFFSDQFPGPDQIPGIYTEEIFSSELKIIFLALCDYAPFEGSLQMMHEHELRWSILATSRFLGHNIHCAIEESSLNSSH